MSVIILCSSDDEVELDMDDEGTLADGSPSPSSPTPGGNSDDAPAAAAAVAGGAEVPSDDAPAAAAASAAAGGVEDLDDPPLLAKKWRTLDTGNKLEDLMLHTLRCSVCFNIDGKVTMCKAEHTTCERCTNELFRKAEEKWPNEKVSCPVCMVVVEKHGHNAMKVNMKARDFAAALGVEAACRFTCNGCNEAPFSFENDGLHEHEKHCKYESVPCGFSGCNFLGSVYEMRQHLAPTFTPMLPMGGLAGHVANTFVRYCEETPVMTIIELDVNTWTAVSLVTPERLNPTKQTRSVLVDMIQRDDEGNHVRTSGAFLLTIGHLALEPAHPREMTTFTDAGAFKVGVTRLTGTKNARGGSVKLTIASGVCTEQGSHYSSSSSTIWATYGGFPNAREPPAEHVITAFGSVGASSLDIRLLISSDSNTTESSYLPPFRRCPQPIYCYSSSMPKFASKEEELSFSTLTPLFALPPPALTPRLEIPSDVESDADLGQLVQQFEVPPGHFMGWKDDDSGDFSSSFVEKATVLAVVDNYVIPRQLSPILFTDVQPDRALSNSLSIICRHDRYTSEEEDATSVFENWFGRAVRNARITSGTVVIMGNDLNAIRRREATNEAKKMIQGRKRRKKGPASDRPRQVRRGSSAASAQCGST